MRKREEVRGSRSKASKGWICEMLRTLSSAGNAEQSLVEQFLAMLSNEFLSNAEQYLRSIIKLAKPIKKNKKRRKGGHTPKKGKYQFL